MFTTTLIAALSTTLSVAAPSETTAQDALDLFRQSYSYAKCSQTHFDSTKDEAFALDIRRDGSLAISQSLSGSGWGKCIAKELSRTQLDGIKSERSLIWKANPYSTKYQSTAIEGVGNPYFLTWEVPTQ